jgi:hypothetical protein
LYLLCLPNTERNSIVKAKDEFTKAVNDVPANKQGSQQKNNLIKLITAEFQVDQIAVNENSFSAISLSYPSRNTEIKSLFTPLTDAQPPEA